MFRISSSHILLRRAAHQQHNRQAVRSAALDRLREASGAGGRRGKYSTSRSQVKREQKFGLPQAPPNAREQMLLLKRASKRAAALEAPAHIRERKKELRCYSAEFGLFFYFREDDLFEGAILGRGPGGQATNRRKQTCQVQHKPTGIIVRFSRMRSLYANRKAARILLSLRVEERLFGKYSRLGTENCKLRARNVRKREMRKRLLKKSEAAKAASAAAAGAASSTSNARASQLGGGEAVPPLSVCLKTAVQDGAERCLDDENCWKSLALVNFSPQVDPPAPSCCPEELLSWKQATVACGSMELEDLPRAPATRDALMQSPFLESWWRLLEAAVEASLLNRQQQKAQQQLSTLLDDTGPSAVCPFAPPVWFCVLFPVLPSSPPHKFVGPSAAWECRLRSYLSCANSPHCEAQLRRPYPLFFEMFGLRTECAIKTPASAHSARAADLASCTRVQCIVRDGGLNWFEGRAKFSQGGDGALALLLWRHVLISAAEFGLTDVVNAALAFLNDAAQNEKHAPTRDVIQLIWRKCAWLRD